MLDAEIIAAIRTKYQALRPVLDEKVRRRWAACEAMAIGWGGITAVAEATGLARPTIRAGLVEVRGGAADAVEEPDTERQRLRRVGGGRRRVTESDPALLKDLQALVEASTRGDPQSPLLWTSKSTRHLAEALAQQGHQVSHHTIARLLEDLHYSLQANRKTQEGSSHPDRNAPFEHINKQVRAFQNRGQPVVSVDAKKKELIGDFKNAGREWHPQGQPVKVRSKDFVDQHLGKGIPYGVYQTTSKDLLRQSAVQLALFHRPPCTIDSAPPCMTASLQDATYAPLPHSNQARGAHGPDARVCATAAGLCRSDPMAL